MSDAFDLENPTEEHRLLRNTLRDFVRQVVEPQADEHDRSGVMDKALLKRVGDLGLLGVTIPADDGGAGMDAVAAALVSRRA